MLTNLAWPISRLRGEWDYTTVQRLHFFFSLEELAQTKEITPKTDWSYGTEG